MASPRVAPVTDPEVETPPAQDADAAAESTAPGPIRAKPPSRQKLRARQKKRRLQRRKVSRLTMDPNAVLDYKDPKTLRMYLTPEGKILPRRINGNTAKQQRRLAPAIKRARHIALLPYAGQEE